MKASEARKYFDNENAIVINRRVYEKCKEALDLLEKQEAGLIEEYESQEVKQSVAEGIELYNKKQAGLIIELPVPIGTEVWEFVDIWSGDGDHIEGIEIMGVPIEFDLMYHLDKWGKTVFATREEAEKRFAELRGEK